MTEKEAKKYQRCLGLLYEALNVYADEEFYHAILVLPDRPAGGFADDFSRVKGSHYNRPMPGKLARETLNKALKRYGGLKYLSRNE